MSFLPVRVSTLRGDQAINFDAYIKIADKQILYIHKGDSFEGTRLRRLKDKKVKKLYIMAEDEGNYRSYLTRNIEMAYDPHSTKSIETRAEIIQGSQQANAENLIEDPKNEALYDKTKGEASRFVEFLFREDRALAYIIAQENLDKSVAHHGVTVATLATGIAKRTGGFDPRQLQALTLGALIHDIEHFYTAIDVARPRDMFTDVEAKTYYTHARQGMERLAQYKHIDPIVLRIVQEHEEHIDGSGFPEGLKESKLDPVSVVVASANAIDRMVTFDGISRNDAVKELTIHAVGSYPLAHIQILGDLLKGT